MRLRIALACTIVCCGASIVAHFARKVRATKMKRFSETPVLFVACPLSVGFSCFDILLILQKKSLLFCIDGLLFLLFCINS